MHRAHKVIHMLFHFLLLILPVLIHNSNRLFVLSLTHKSKNHTLFHA